MGVALFSGSIHVFAGGRRQEGSVGCSEPSCLSPEHCLNDGLRTGGGGGRQRLHLDEEDGQLTGNVKTEGNTARKR